MLPPTILGTGRERENKSGKGRDQEPDLFVWLEAAIDVW